MNTLVAFRSYALSQVRAFFKERGYLEVDVPALSRYPSIDAHIDPYVTTCGKYLHTSPEYAMKRLLANGSGNIYYLGHTYRKEEFGSLHNSEFTMVEWYKTNTNEKDFILEVLEFLSLFLDVRHHSFIDYEVAMKKHEKTLPPEAANWCPDEVRHYVFSHHVEPNLGNDEITIVTNFLPEDAALAKTHFVNDQERAMRYELFYKGIELGNGFNELTDPIEQRKRFNEANFYRTSHGKSYLPIDESFLNALNKGLPENTFGMAAGFDRLLMLAKQKASLSEVLPFTDLTI